MLQLTKPAASGPDARYGRDDMKPMDTGHTVDHVTSAGRLVTVFSAPDYPQFRCDDDERIKNTASVLKLLPPTYSEYTVIEYSAVARPHATCCYDNTLPGSDAEMEGDFNEAEIDDDASSVVRSDEPEADHEVAVPTI